MLPPFKLMELVIARFGIVTESMATLPFTSVTITSVCVLSYHSLRLMQDTCYIKGFARRFLMQTCVGLNFVSVILPCVHVADDHVRFVHVPGVNVPVHVRVVQLAGTQLTTFHVSSAPSHEV